MSGISIVRIAGLDDVLAEGNTSTNFAEIDGSITTANVVTSDRTITTGDTHTHGNLTLNTGRAWTVDSGGTLISLGDLTINGTGTLTVNGTSIVIS